MLPTNISSLIVSSIRSNLKAVSAAFGCASTKNNTVNRAVYTKLSESCGYHIIPKGPDRVQYQDLIAEKNDIVRER